MTYSKTSLVRIPNDEMDLMRNHEFIGIPVYFSDYPGGVFKVYPLPAAGNDPAGMVTGLNYDHLTIPLPQS